MPGVVGSGPGAADLQQQGRRPAMASVDQAARRANGEGSVFESATRGWCASITDLDGRRITRKAPVQTRAGAEKLLRQLLRDRDEGAVARRSMTLERYVPEWLQAAQL